MKIEVEVGYPSRSLVTRLLSLVRKVGKSDKTVLPSNWR
jgi:hypothetical protein